MEDFDKYYGILEIKSDATEKEIKEAYKQLSMVWHPDRFQNNPKLAKKAEAKFKEINKAYNKLKSANFYIYPKTVDPYYVNNDTYFYKVEDINACLFNESLISVCLKSDNFYEEFLNNKNKRDFLEDKHEKNSTAIEEDEEYQNKLNELEEKYDELGQEYGYDFYKNEELKEINKLNNEYGYNLDELDEEYEKKLNEINEEEKRIFKKYLNSNGLRISKIDYEKFIKEHSLKLKSEYYIGSIQFGIAGMGIYSKVWAMPKDTSLQIPNVRNIKELLFCGEMKYSHLEDREVWDDEINGERAKKNVDIIDSLIKPRLALDNIMKAIDGDGSPWSYLSASLLNFQIHKLGLYGSFIEFGETLSEFYLEGGMFENINNYKLIEPIPQSFYPSVRYSKNQIHVSFYSLNHEHYYGCLNIVIYRHSYFYASNYNFVKYEKTKIAEMQFRVAM